MPTHLYCLLPAGRDVAPPDSPAVRALVLDGIVAWVADAASARLPRDLREAARATLEHDRVVSVPLSHGVTPVPASLADPYESDAAALSDVEAHGESIVAALAVVDGRVEMTTIVAVHDTLPAAEAAGRGRAYLEQLRSLPSRAASIADRVAARLSAVAGAAARRNDGGRVALSHLIPVSDVERYRSAARSCDGEGYRIVIDGPRAPYSFAAFAPGRGISARSTTTAA